MSDERKPATLQLAFDADDPAHLAALDDDELMRRLAGGAKSAFTVLVNRHYPRVRAVAGRLVRTPALADDAVQATFVDVLETAARYQPRGKFRAWLYRVMLNRCRMLQRRDRYDARLAERLPMPLELVDPSDAVSAAQLRQVTQAAVDALAPKLREVVHLRFTAGLAITEIAATLGVPAGTVKSRLFKAMEKLKVSLPAELFDGFE